jgi:hypothetical protein
MINVGIQLNMRKPLSRSVEDERPRLDVGLWDKKMGKVNTPYPLGTMSARKGSCFYLLFSD